jgi:hypothetical protein
MDRRAMKQHRGRLFFTSIFSISAPMSSFMDTNSSHFGSVPLSLSLALLRTVVVPPGMMVNFANGFCEESAAGGGGGENRGGNGWVW